jgi:HEPN domain-containing protein
VDQNKRKMVEGWLTKASNHLDTARESLKSVYRVSDSVQASQVCVELSVKAMLVLLEIPYPPSHGWGRKELGEIAKKVQERDLLQRLAAQSLYIRLPRFLFLANFWSQFYLEAKYGIEAGYLAPAQDLFEMPDAELAVSHANECLHAALTLRSLPQEQLATLTAQTTSESAT